MATSIKLDQNNDIVFDDIGLSELVTGPSDIIQAIRVELTQNLKQWALSETWGTPWIADDGTGLLQDKKSKAEITRKVTAIIKKYEVKEVVSVTLEDGTLKAIIKIDDREEEILV